MPELAPDATEAVETRARATGLSWLEPFWTAVAAIGSSAATGVVTYRITNRQVGSAERIASEERQQARRGPAYVELLENIARVTAWALWTGNADQRGLAAIPSAPEQIDPDRWYRMIALTRAFGSRTVMIGFAELHQKSQLLGSSLDLHRPSESHPPPEYHESEAVVLRDRLRGEIIRISNELQPTMANELQGPGTYTTATLENGGGRTQ